MYILLYGKRFKVRKSKFLSLYSEYALLLLRFFLLYVKLIKIYHKSNQILQSGPLNQVLFLLLPLQGGQHIEPCATTLRRGSCVVPPIYFLSEQREKRWSPGAAFYLVGTRSYLRTCAVG